MQLKPSVLRTEAAITPDDKALLAHGSHTLRSQFPVETELRFDAAQGRRLVFSRGDVDVQVSFAVRRTCASCHLEELDGDRPETFSGITDGDTLLLTAAVADREGRVFAATRELDPCTLVELLGIPRWVPARERWRPLLAGFHAWYDHRNILPAIAFGQSAPFAYWGKNLRLELALYSWPAQDTDYLIVVGLPQTGVALSGADAPEAAASTSWAARLAMAPSMWWGATGERRLTFALRDGASVPQPGVWEE